MKDTIMINSQTYDLGQLTVFKKHLYKCIKVKDGYMCWFKHSEDCKECGVTPC